MNIVKTLGLHGQNIITEYNGNHCLLSITIETLVNVMKPINWKHNRPADETRWRAIAKSIFNKRTHFDTIIYVHYNSTNDTFEIIDGLHRFSAIKHIYNENIKQLNPLETNDYGCNRDATWFYNSSIVVSVYSDRSFGELAVIFENLNNSVPIPSIFIPEPNPGQKKQAICDTALSWQRRYPKHFSDGNRTKVPNINRDRFMDILSEVYDSTEGKHNLLDLLNATNIRMKQYYTSNITHVKISEQTISKCTDNDCWLFIVKPDNLIEEIKKTAVCKILPQQFIC
jgi:hypothetical protein